MHATLCSKCVWVGDVDGRCESEIELKATKFNCLCVRERERERQVERDSQTEGGEEVRGKLALEMRGIAGDLTTFNPIKWNAWNLALLSQWILYLRLFRAISI